MTKIGDWWKWSHTTSWVTAWVRKVKCRSLLIRGWLPPATPRCDRMGNSSYQTPWSWPLTDLRCLTPLLLGTSGWQIAPLFPAPSLLQMSAVWPWPVLIFWQTSLWILWEGRPVLFSMGKRALLFCVISYYPQFIEIRLFDVSHHFGRSWKFNRCTWKSQGILFQSSSCHPDECQWWWVVWQTDINIVWKTPWTTTLFDINGRIVTEYYQFQGSGHWVMWPFFLYVFWSNHLREKSIKIKWCMLHVCSNTEKMY